MNKIYKKISVILTSFVVNKSLNAYTMGRILSVSFRPSCLFLANNYLSGQTSQALASTFLGTSLALIFTAADPHRRYYATLFSKEKKNYAYMFWIYFVSVILLGIMGAGIVIILNFSITKSFLLAVAALIYYFSEKFVDECLRILLFNKDFANWGKATSLRALIQFAILVAFLLAYPSYKYTFFLIFFLAATNLVVFLPQLDPKIFNQLTRLKFSTFKNILIKSIRNLVKNIFLWTSLFFTGSILYLDRIISLVVNVKILPLFLLVSTCLTIIHMSIDFFYVSRHRRDFLDNSVEVNTALLSKDFLSSLFYGAILSFIVASLVLLLSKNSDLFEIKWLFTLFLTQILLSITEVPRNILYWRDKTFSMLCIESSFFIAFFIFIFWQQNSDMSKIFEGMAILALYRFFAFYLMVFAFNQRNRS